MMVFISISAFSQNISSYLKTLPKGYQIDDWNGEPAGNIEVDFDKDGKKDLAIILYSVERGEEILCIFLSSSFNKDQSYQWCDWGPWISNEFEFNNNKLGIYGSRGDKNYVQTLELSYNSVIKKMKVVSYTQASENKILKLKDGKITP